LYVKRTEAEFGKLLWVHNNKPNEMLLGAYGLDGRPASITHEFPEHFYARGESRTFKIRYEGAALVGVKIDHFTCHADGTFHAKARESEVLYSQIERTGRPLGRESPPFLRVLVVSDQLARYAAISKKPVAPHVWFSAQPDRCLVINMVFSGVQYPLEQPALATIAGRGKNAVGTVLVSGSLKGLIWGTEQEMSADIAASRPPGTLFSFQWSRGVNRWGYKTFILN
jgi:hypothetical protein